MSKNTYVAEVKERQKDEPCFLWIADEGDIGIGDRSILLELTEPASLEKAEMVAKFLHENVRAFKLSK